MARLMLSAGMFSALAATRPPRKRGLESGSPPPFFAAMLISLMRRVKILPRLASSAPFLCLIVAHFEWPDMNYLGADLWCERDAQLCEFSMFALSLACRECTPPSPGEGVQSLRNRVDRSGLETARGAAAHWVAFSMHPLCWEVCQVFRLFSQRLAGNRRSSRQMNGPGCL